MDSPGEFDGLIRALVRWPLLAALVGAVVVVVGIELSQDPAQVPGSDDEQVVHAFSTDGADEPLGIGVRPGSLDRGFDDPRAT